MFRSSKSLKNTKMNSIAYEDSLEEESVWSQPNVPNQIVLLVPVGVEVAGIRIARREFGVKFKKLAAGLIVSKSCTSQMRKQILDVPPRWTFGSFFLVSKIDHREEPSPAVRSRIEDELTKAVEQYRLNGLQYWLWSTDVESKRYSTSILNDMDFGLVNNPSNYRITLKLHADKDQIFVLLGRSISVKARFSYRKKDVGASINPVLAAFLVRLLPKSPGGKVIDPVCGSGTLLVERFLYSEESEAIGIDISETAKLAFTQNMHKVSESKDVTFRLADSAHPQFWSSCTSVVCNLPFGIRIKQPPERLKKLYLGILNNALDCISDDGRVLMVSSFKGGLEYAVEATSKRCILLSRYRLEMGGLFYQVIVLKRRVGVVVAERAATAPKIRAAL